MWLPHLHNVAELGQCLQMDHFDNERAKDVIKRVAQALQEATGQRGERDDKKDQVTQILQELHKLLN